MRATKSRLVEITKSSSDPSVAGRLRPDRTKPVAIMLGRNLRQDAAPELRASEEVGATRESDVWDLGVVLAEIISGTTFELFEGDVEGLRLDVRCRVAAAPSRHHEETADCLTTTIKVHTPAAATCWGWCGSLVYGCGGGAPVDRRLASGGRREGSGRSVGSAAGRRTGSRTWWAARRAPPRPLVGVALVGGAVEGGVWRAGWRAVVQPVGERAVGEAPFGSMWRGVR